MNDQAALHPGAPIAYSLAATIRAFNTNKTSWLGLIVFLLVGLAAIFAPALAPHNPLEQDLLVRLRPPSLEHLLGTDNFGRDTLSRLLYGARLSLIIGLT